MSYEDYFSAEDVATYRRVKRGSMRLARVTREVLADMLRGHVSTVGKEVLITRHATYRVANGHNADNTTEQAALNWMGVETLNVSDPEQLGRVLARHGWQPLYGVTVFRERVRTALSEVAA